MIKIMQEAILLLSGYILILILLGGFFIVSNFRKWYREEDSTVVNLQEWKELQIKNNQLKKEKEILKIENSRLEKLNYDIAEDLKYFNQGR